MISQQTIYYNVIMSTCYFYKIFTSHAEIPGSISRGQIFLIPLWDRNQEDGGTELKLIVSDQKYSQLNPNSSAGISFKGLYNAAYCQQFVRLTWRLNLDTSLVIFDKSRLMPAQGFSFALPHLIFTIFIRLRILFSNTFSLHSSLDVRDHISQPYSSTGDIIVLHF